MEVKEKDIKTYRENLENLVLQHIYAGAWTLSKGSDYVSKMVDTIFGTENYSGIIQYLVEDQPHLKLTLEEAISKSESLIQNGWHIKETKGKYYLVDGNFREVKNVTGTQDYVEEVVEEDIINAENCWKLLDEGLAKELAREAIVNGIDSTMLVSPEFTYTFVTSKLGTEHELFPFAQMYKGMGSILRKLNYYQTEDDFFTLNDMMNAGYKISPKLNPSSVEKSYIKLGTKAYTVLPVSDKTIGDEPADKLFVQDARLKRELLKSIGVEVETPIEIGEIDHIFALGFLDNENYSDVQDLGEVSRIVLTTNQQGKDYPLLENLQGQLAAVYITENFIFGNRDFTLGSITIDTVKPQVRIRYTGSGRGYTQKEIKYALENARESTDLSFSEFFTLCPSIDDPEAMDFLGKLIKMLPRKFVDSVKVASSEDIYVQTNLNILKGVL